MDARPPDRRETNNTQKIVVPGKMFVPALLPGVIQWDNGFREGVIPGHFGELGPIAALTGKSQVIQRIIAASAARVNVFHAERLRRETGWAEAVFTKTVRTFRDLGAFFASNPLIHKMPSQPKLLPHFIEGQAAQCGKVHHCLNAVCCKLLALVSHRQQLGVFLARDAG